MLPCIALAFSAEEKPEEFVKRKVLIALRKRPLAFEQLREKTKMDSSLLVLTLSRLIRARSITAHSETGEVVYQFVPKAKHLP